MNCVLVVPCYNEASRLEEAPFRELFESSLLRLLFVNDGSTDDTLELLDVWEKRYSNVRVLDSKHNQGKGEAVRLGLNSAIEAYPESDWLGYYDADLATPPSEVIRFLEIARKTDYKVILASRVRLLGTDIKRRMVRHYLGRVFATGASLALNLGVYDTQCGFKLFRKHPALKAALVERFRSPWVFDVELIARLMRNSYREGDFLEVPLKKWEDVGGSRLSFPAMLAVPFALLRIALYLRHWGS